MAKVLIVDDSSFQRKWIAKAVMELGHSIVEAVDGRDGLDVLERENPDCVTVDLNMPNMDGLEFLSNLIGREKSPPVIVVTANIQNKTKEQCEQLGARAFLNKPFKNEDIQEALAKCLNENTGE